MLQNEPIRAIRAAKVRQLFETAIFYPQKKYSKPAKKSTFIFF